MEVIKRVRLIIGFNILLIILGIIGFITELLTGMMLLTFIIAEMATLIALYYLLLKPIINFDELVKQCIENEMGSNKILEKFSGDSIFVREMKCVIENYSSKKIKENLDEISDKEVELAAL